jgi:hypothetical protein
MKQEFYIGSVNEVCAIPPFAENAKDGAPSLSAEWKGGAPGHLPHRDEAAMNGAQMRSLDRDSTPRDRAACSSPAHRDEAAMNGAQMRFPQRRFDPS